MKKNYKKIAILVFGLFIFGLVGIGRVNATGFNNVAVICVPESLEKGEKGVCYFVAAGQEKEYGVYLIPATKYLTITDFNSNQAIKNPDKLEVKKLGEGESVTDTYNNAARELFKCDLTPGTTGSYYSADAKEKGYTQPKNCYALQSKGNTENVDPTFISPKQSEIDATEFSKKASANSAYQYHEIAYFNVKLDDDAPANNCGTLCLDVRYYAYNYSTELSHATANNTNQSSNGEQKNYPLQYVCGEITITGTPNEPTGNFASYAVLIGGACIALVAVVVATKNKKIYNV